MSARSCSTAGATSRPSIATSVVVPAVASVQQLFDRFREEERQIALVVDEYGGTEGVVSLEDAGEEIVGDIAAPDETAVPEPADIGHGRWRVAGDLPAGQFARRFGVALSPDAPATAGGLVLERLGREPHRGDRVILDELAIEVESVQRGRIRSFVASRPEGAP